MAPTYFTLFLICACVVGFESRCSHMLINSQCWLKKCSDEVLIQCGSIDLNVSKSELNNFAAVSCYLVHREIPSSFIKQKIQPNVYAINRTTNCDGFCNLLSNN